MKKYTSTLLTAAAVAVILSPIWGAVLSRKAPPPPPPPARPAPEPVLKKPATDPEVWFAAMQPRCTPAEVRLATDLDRPPAGVAGTGYEAACYALAHNIPNARALLLGLPEEDRVVGASRVYDVAQRLAGQGNRQAAGPLMELVLEFWPNHYMALYDAGTARYTAGDLVAANLFLQRFLDVYIGDDSMVANAQHMMGRSNRPSTPTLIAGLPALPPGEPW